MKINYVSFKNIDSNQHALVYFFELIATLSVNILLFPVNLMLKIFSLISSSAGPVAKNILSNKKIFVFGSPHAGKSTMLASITHYLQQSDHYELRRDPINNKEGVKIIRELNEKMKQGDFPPPTHPDFWSSVGIEFNKEEESRLYKRTFLELPGEISEAFDPVHENHNNIDNELKEFLNNSHAVMIVASAKPETNNEKNAINDFLEYLDRKKYKGPILMVITKSDAIDKDRYDDYIDFCKETYTNSLGILSRNQKGSLLEFSVGDVIDDKIVLPKFDVYVPPIIEWMEGL